MTPEWTDLGPADLADGALELRKTAAGARLLVLSDGGELRAFDDRCPHEGYPLSQGSLRNGELTCAWHNWKFDVCSGACTTGGDAVRRYPTRVREARLEVDVAIDAEAEADKAAAGIAAGLFENDPSRAVRDGLRLAALPGRSMSSAFAVLAVDAARRHRWGFGHELAALADLLTWVDAGDLDEVEALTLAATWIGARLTREPARPAPPPAAARSTVEAITRMLEDEDIPGAEGAVRALVRTDGVDAALQSLLPFVASHLLDYGHGAIYLAKAHALAQRLPDAAEELMAAVAVTLGWGTRESSLPPWAATRRTLEAVGALGRGDARLEDRAAYEAALLEGEGPAVHATLARLEAGVAVPDLAVAIAHAASERVSRFDPTLADRLDLDASILDVSHLVTHAEAVIALLPSAAPRDAARLLVLSAGFVGKLAAADRAVDRDSPATKGTVEDLVAAVRSRDIDTARAYARGLDPDARNLAFTRLRDFAAHDAFVRPIFAIHAVKGLEALRRLHARDPSPRHLVAFAELAVRRWPERSARRTAATARKFLADGKPPRGLY